MTRSEEAGNGASMSMEDLGVVCFFLFVLIFLCDDACTCHPCDPLLILDPGRFC